MTTIDIAVPPVSEAERDMRLAAAARMWGERLDQDYTNARIAVHASGRAHGSVATQVQTGAHRFVIDEPAALAGDDVAPSPVEYALGALIGCQVVVYRLYAARLDLDIDDIQIDVIGDIDVRGLFGLDEDVRPGFGAIELEVRITGPERPERYQELVDAVGLHCPVLDLFRHETPVKSTLIIGVR